jgi:hypothetical protein
MLHVTPSKMVGGGQVVELVSEEPVAAGGRKVKGKLHERDAG